MENQATQITHTTNFDFNQNSAANVFATLSVPHMSMNLSPAPYTNVLNPLSGVGSGKMPLIPKAGSGLIRAQDQSLISNSVGNQQTMANSSGLSITAQMIKDPA